MKKIIVSIVVMLMATAAVNAQSKSLFNGKNLDLVI